MYRLANEGLKKGDLISFFDQKKQFLVQKNQYAVLNSFFTSSEIFNVEIRPNNKGKLIKAAGCKGKLLRKYNKYGLIVLPSKEKKLLSL